MKKLQFWQKTYLITLLLFLAALYGGIFFIGWSNQKQMIDGEVEKAKSQQYFIAKNLDNEFSKVEDNIYLSENALIRSYANYYLQFGINLEVKNGNEEIYTNLPATSNEIEMKENKQYWYLNEVGSDTYIYTSSLLSNGYNITSTISITPVLEVWEDMRNTFTIASLIVSIIMAIILFFILKSLSKPLEKLASIADEFAKGNLKVRGIKKNDDEIGRLNDSFNNMAEKIEEQILSIRKTAEANEQMTANLAHEIRTPLTAIQGYAEYIRMADLSLDEKEKSLSYIISESKRLLKISERMLELYSLEYNSIELKPVSIKKVLEQVELSTRVLRDDKDISLEVNDISDAIINGDNILLESLFINLIDNAIKACEKGGSIVVYSHVDKENLVVHVVDDGCGIKDEDIGKIGEAFYRPNKSRSRSDGGAGLGVALSNRIVELHKGKLNFISSTKGTEVIVQFPLKDIK